MSPLLEQQQQQQQQPNSQPRPRRRAAAPLPAAKSNLFQLRAPSHIQPPLNSQQSQLLARNPPLQPVTSRPSPFQVSTQRLQLLAALWSHLFPHFQISQHQPRVPKPTLEKLL